MRYTLFLFIVALAAGETLAQSDEPAQMRAETLGKRFPRALPMSLPEARSHDWQAAAPKALKRSLRPPLAADLKLEPRLAAADRGYVERVRPATEQLALGLSSDPPRPEVPQLAAGPRASGPALSPFEVVQLPPISRTSDAPLTLTGDPATIAARPHTSPLVAASRGPAPPRSDIGIPDPFAIQQEAKLRTVLTDADPPAPSFGAPERPMLPVEIK